MREYVFMECSECKRRYYRTEHETKGGTKLELSKYCKFCHKHTLHKERKK